MKLYIGKILRYALPAVLLYLLICCFFPPLSQHKSDKNFIGTDMDYGKATGAEQVLCIDDNLDALLWRLRVIESARDELILSTFNFCDDNSGLDIMAALKAAADRGVQVKILVDGLHGFLNLKGSSAFQSLVSLPNVEAKLYNPVRLISAWTGNYRLHDKYLIADDSVYILGGRNIGDLFLGSYADNANIDRDVLVYENPDIPADPAVSLLLPDTDEAETGVLSSGAFAGTSMERLREYFRVIWDLPSNETLSCRQSIKRTETGKQLLDAHYETLKEVYPEAFGQTDWAAATISADRVLLCTNPIAPENKAPTLWENLCGFMAASGEAVIQTPYVICDSRMYDDLAAVTADGTQVTVLTNAPETGANPWGCSDYQNQKKRILSTGVGICEYPGEHSVHAKTVLLDDNISIIGSYNMDIRSTYLDTEMMLVIDCPELNRSLKESAAEMASVSRLCLPDGNVTYGANYTAPAKGFFRQCLHSVLRIACPLIRHIL